jgi:hypothetical protein
MRGRALASASNQRVVTSVPRQLAVLAVPSQDQAGWPGAAKPARRSPTSPPDERHHHDSECGDHLGTTRYKRHCTGRPSPNLVNLGTRMLTSGNRRTNVLGSRASFNLGRIPGEQRLNASRQGPVPLYYSPVKAFCQRNRLHRRACRRPAATLPRRTIARQRVQDPTASRGLPLPRSLRPKAPRPYLRPPPWR